MVSSTRSADKALAAEDAVLFSDLLDGQCRAIERYRRPRRFDLGDGKFSEFPVQPYEVVLQASDAELLIAHRCQSRPREAVPFCHRHRDAYDDLTRDADFARWRTWQHSLRERHIEAGPAVRPHVVYRCFHGEILLYVGMSKSQCERAMSHTHRFDEPVTHIAITHYSSFAAANEAETVAIRSERPKYNIAKVPA